MRPLLRAVLSLLALPLALAGCDLTTDPISLEISFVPNHTTAAGGVCTVQYAALASGFGTARWERVTVRRGTQVLSEYLGEQTAQFWGKATLSAGEQLLSQPIQIPAASVGELTIDVEFRLSSIRNSLLQPQCPAAPTT